MFLTTHAAAGVIISQQFDSVPAVFGLSLLSHFFMDFIPHGDETLYEEWKPERRKRAAILGGIDLVLVAIMLLFLYQTTELPRIGVLSAGIAGALLPDLISHVFPYIHQRYRELVIFRPLKILKSNVFLLHPLLKQHNWLHKNFHTFVDRFFDYRISPLAGFSIQVIIIAIFLVGVI